MGGTKNRISHAVLLVILWLNIVQSLKNFERAVSEKIEVKHFFCRVATLKNQLFQKMKKTAAGISEKLLYTKFQLNRTIGSRDTPRTDRGRGRKKSRLQYFL